MNVFGPAIGRRVGNPLPAAVAAAFGALYSLFALGLHRSYSTRGFDLGIFEQAVRGYAHGKLPVSTIRDPQMILFGDHFHPILAVLAPFYRLFPATETLLIAQALLLAASVFPVTRIACDALGWRSGVVVGGCYGLSWGLQTTLGYDFHEIAFAVPLLAFALEAVLRGRPGRAVAIASFLVLVKEDLGMTLAVLGLLLALQPSTRKLGLVTAAAGSAASLTTVFLVIPAFRSDGEYRYLGAGGLKPTSEAFAGQPLDAGKLYLVLLLLVPTLFLAVRSPLVLLMLPTLAWRLAGTNKLYWWPAYHYDSVLMPILFCALVHSLMLLRRPAVTRRGPCATMADSRFRVAVLAGMVCICAISITQFPFKEMLRPNFGRPPVYAAAAARLMSRIPDGASVAADSALAPHLTSRTNVYQLNFQRTEWMLAFGNRPEVVCPLVKGADTVLADGGLILIHRPDSDALPEAGSGSSAETPTVAVPGCAAMT